MLQKMKSLCERSEKSLKPFDVAIAGEINLDLILYGLPMQMPVERELLASDFRVTLGSSSAIVAHNLASLGSRVSFTTMVGPDDFGRIALDRLTASGVDTSHTLHHPTLTTGVTLLLPHGRERHILTYPGTIAELTASHLDFDHLKQARHLHLSSLYLQRGLQQGLASLFARLKQAGLTLSLDTNDDPDDRWGAPLQELLPYVDVFLPSESEICRIARTRDLDEAIATLAPRPPAIVVKRGPKGARIHDQGRSVDIPAIPVTPIDTVGAGDSFDAGFLHAWLSGCDLTTAAHAGNITGALSTQAPGGTEAFRDSSLRERFLRDAGFFRLFNQSE
jgi:sugar/nucleoside kinase (ribokinase family)